MASSGNNPAGFYYLTKNGDTVSSVLEQAEVPRWLMIYDHEKNSSYKNKCQDPQKILPGEKLWIPSVEWTSILSSKAYQIVVPRSSVFVDAHMHIESNNCCPLPIQWGLAKKNAGIRVKGNRLALTALAGLATGRFGQIGGLSTDKIAGIYMGKVKNEDKAGLGAKMLFAVPRIGGTLIANSDSGLTLLTEKTEENYEINFRKASDYYYKANPIERLSYALLMDMSFSHFWGKFGLPVCLPLKNGMAFINDFVMAGVFDGKADFSAAVGKPVTETGVGTFHLYAKHLSGENFSFKEQFDRFEGRLKSPALLKESVTVDSFISFSRNANDLTLQKMLVEKPFVHIVEDLPGNETKNFESYKTQIRLSKIAAMNSPLRMIPFYHFDPRCHWNLAKRESLLANLQADHSFHRVKKYGVVDRLTDKFSDFLHIVPDPDLGNSGFLNALLNNVLSTAGDAFQEVFATSSNGIFWGIKMYPRLGFKPEDEQTYPQLAELYRTCSEKSIPITTHCSRGGMSIADYYCYQRYDAENHLEGYGPREKYDLVPAEYWFADRYAAPSNWERVVTKYPKLKLNLAHFGGGDSWFWCKSFEEIENSFPANPNQLPLSEKPNEKNAAEFASIYHSWPRKIAELCNSHENVYTDLSYYLNPENEFAEFETTIETKNGKTILTSIQIDMVAKNLAFLIGKFPKLKEKIMMGSDWYMIENDGMTGVGTYFKRMFGMLRIASHYLEYDAWHQFAVINPLNFLGLLTKEGDDFKIEIAKLENYLERLSSISKDRSLKQKFQNVPPTDSINATGKELISKIKKNPIVLNSSKIKNSNNELTILGG